MLMACLRVQLLVVYIVLQLAPYSSWTWVSGASSVCIREHRDALLEFKRQAVENDPKGWLSSWALPANISSTGSSSSGDDGGSDCCQWKGVECDDQGNVVGLNLSNCNGYDPTDQALLVRNQQKALQGSLTPAALLALSSSSISNVSSTLSTLDLGCQLFHGIIPPEIGSLASLSYLDLSFQAQGPQNIYNKNDSAHVLSGPIPNELWSLPHLSHLDLGSNSISGSISTDVGHCTSLVNLYLGTNNLTGEVPSSLRNLTLLKALDLSSNTKLHSLPPSDWVPSFVGLQSLDISLCSFSGPFPSWVRYLTNLSSFTLTGNHFSGEIPEWAWRIAKNLLDFSNNKFNNTLACDTGPVPHTSLTSFDVSYNGDITGTIPCFVANLTSLITLSFAGNSLYGPIPGVFGNLRELQTLDLSENQFDGMLPSSMQNLHSLVSLDLDTNLLSPQEVPSFLLRLPSMVRLHLSNNNFTAISIPNDQLVGNSTLEFLKLSSNKISGHIPSSLSIIHPNLKFLRLDNNQLSGDVPQSLSLLNKLQTLDLSYNSLTGPLPSSLGNLSSLIILNIHGNPIGGPLPSFIGSLDQLLVLDLGSCDLNGSIASSTFASLPQLQVLVLSNNHLSGSIPSSLGQLQGMTNSDHGSSVQAIEEHVNYITDDLDITFKGENATYHHVELLADLDLSNNQLDGPIPPELGNLTQLLSLDLSRNKLDGEIPSALGKLVKLESLDLSQNGLEGEIPQSFNDLTGLGYVNVSSNHLRGTIPTAPQWLQTFAMSAFQDNDGLCTNVEPSLAMLPLCSIAPSPSTIPSQVHKLHNHHNGLEGVVQWSGFVIGYLVGFLVGVVCILAHFIYKHGSLRLPISRLHANIKLLLSGLWSKTSNDDLTETNDAKYPMVEEGTSNQDWHAIIARIQEELSTSSLSYMPIQVEPT